jgi:hypothetical protein
VIKLLIVFILPSTCFAQKSCIYNKPKKFEEYTTNLSTEYSGLILNGINLKKKLVQLEGNSYLGAILNSYDNKVYAGFFQVRYALLNTTEIQIGGFFQNPPAINVDTLYNQQIQVGIKQKVFKIDNHMTQWYLACSAKYFLQRSWLDTNQIRDGFIVSLNNSWKIKEVIHIDLSCGIQYFQVRNLLQPFISGKILIKDDLSRIGIFMGFFGDHYTESLLTLGIHYTDNSNYIFLLALGFLDKAITPNISYTQVFNNRR